MKPFSTVMLSKARSLVKQYCLKHMHDTALFWAEKALTLSSGDSTDLYTFAEILFVSGQFQRAIHVLSVPGLLRSPNVRYLVARCYAACKDWEKVSY